MIDLSGSYKSLHRTSAASLYSFNTHCGEDIGRTNSLLQSATDPLSSPAPVGGLEATSEDERL